MGSRPPLALACPGRQAAAMATVAPPVENRPLGIAMRIVAATSFAVMAALLKSASGRGVTLPELVFYRNAWAMLVVALWISAGPGWAAVRTRQPWAHLTRGGLGLVSIFLTFGALALLPLGEATTLTYIAPILSTLLSALLLREAIGWRRWLAVVGGFVGMLLVVRPGDIALPLAGIAVGIGSAFAQAAVMLTLRQIGRTEHTAAIVFWFTLMTAIVGGAMLPLFGHWHDRETEAMLAIAGLLGGIGQLTMTASLRHAPVSAVVPFDYVQILWATLFGWLIFAAPLLPTTLAGAALITVSGIYTAYRERMRGREPAQALAPPEG